MIAERGFLQKRARGLTQIDPETARREPERGDAEVRERLRSLGAERRRLGYRCLGILLEREGNSMNKKRLFRLYRGRPGDATAAGPKARHRNPCAHGPAGSRSAINLTCP